MGSAVRVTIRKTMMTATLPAMVRNSHFLHLSPLKGHWPLFSPPPPPPLFLYTSCLYDSIQSYLWMMCSCGTVSVVHRHREWQGLGHVLWTNLSLLTQRIDGQSDIIIRQDGHRPVAWHVSEKCQQYLKKNKEKHILISYVSTPLVFFHCHLYFTSSCFKGGALLPLLVSVWWLQFAKPTSLPSDSLLTTQTTLFAKGTVTLDGWHTVKGVSYLELCQLMVISIL